MTLASMLRFGRASQETTLVLGGLLAVSLVLLVITPTGQAGVDRGADALGVLLIAAMLVPLRWWRRAPVGSLVVPVVAAVVSVLLGYAAALAQLAVFCAVGAAAYGTGLRAALLLGLAGGLAVALAFADTDFGGSVSALNLIVGFLLGTLPAVVGQLLSAQQRSTQRARDHAVRLERIGELEVRRAVAEERVRIARDVHDAVGHHLSAIKLQAGAAKRTVQRDPATAERAVDAIATSAGDALGETRRMLGLLREAELELAPAPRLDDLSGLLDGARGAGLDVEVRVMGTPAPLADVVHGTGYRIVQEALTNVARHAGPAHVAVTVRYEEAAVRLEVRNAATRADPDLTTTGAGHGLIGMRERAALVGGTVRAGPTEAGGWLVQADLPRDPLP